MGSHFDSVNLARKVIDTGKRIYAQRCSLQLYNNKNWRRPKQNIERVQLNYENQFNDTR